MLGCALLSGCLGVELAAPEQEGAWLGGGIALNQSDSLRVEVQVSLIPATDERGRRVPVSSDALILDGHAVSSVLAADGTQEYAAAFALPLLTEQHSIIAEFPGMHDEPHVLPLVLRRGPLERNLMRGHDLVLETLAHGHMDGAVDGGWTLALAESCESGSILGMMQAGGRPPALITVPWALLGQQPPERLEACLRSTGAISIERPDYRVQVAVATVAIWQVSVLD